MKVVYDYDNAKQCATTTLRGSVKLRSNFFNFQTKYQDVDRLYLSTLEPTRAFIAVRPANV